ncbi:hypothetical protein [Acinetobacter larvae]|uniref:Uncharacterized protein n=1 Tax=Acinetobacter larvae TaxID=1789224 RepID=A0A1B2M3B3_9GAMM|nr:hypothetical protein [Acinetobacter larvae]AOA59687.1 hypothetical protein BFG52_15910 [Acinetobacter larvae]
MNNPDQEKLLDALALQQKRQKSLNRILWIALPVIALLITVICANFNWPSTLGTFIALLIAFYVVAIYQKLNLYFCLFLVMIYSLVDIYLSYQGSFPLSAVGRQTATMLVFTGIIGVSRPILERWMMQNNNPNNQ